MIISTNEYEEFLKKEPEARSYIREYLGADEFLNGKKRYCLWLIEAAPSILRLPLIKERVRRVKEYRECSKKEATRKWSEQPAFFTENRQPNTDYIVIPEVSSGARRYIPIGFLSDETICSNKLQLVPDAGLYEFGILTSNVHMAWTRTICGRLKSDYDYSAKIVYNNFPWPEPSDEQRKKIESTAQAILDARALYPEASLADLYDPLTMPPELRKAHQKNDAAVMAAYGMPIKETTEASCVAWLMRLYQEKIEELRKK